MGRTYTTTGITFAPGGTVSVGTGAVFQITGDVQANDGELIFQNGTEGGQPVRMELEGTGGGGDEFYIRSGTQGGIGSVAFNIGDAPSSFELISLSGSQISMDAGTNNQMQVVIARNVVRFINFTSGGTLAELDNNGNLNIAGALGTGQTF